MAVSADTLAAHPCCTHTNGQVMDTGPGLGDITGEELFQPFTRGAKVAGADDRFSQVRPADACMHALCWLDMQAGRQPTPDTHVTFATHHPPPATRALD